VAEALEADPAPTFATFVERHPALARADLLGRPAWMQAPS
jgi:hypothetical protein